MSVDIIQANALNLPLPEDSVDLVVTSPPYFGLRSYQDGGEHYEGQIGDEATPAEFVDALIAATREMMRVVKPTGSIWVNLGDKYANTAPGKNIGKGSKTAYVREHYRDTTGVGVPTKSLIGVPWRYAIRCIDDLGLILRAEVIWSKPNGMPESVTDRVRRSHETWFCFQQSGGIESATQGFPFCPLCGRPLDARTSLIARLKELDRSTEPIGVSDHVVADEMVQSDGVRADDRNVQVGLNSPPVPELVIPDGESVEDGVQLVQNGGVSVVDADTEVGRSVAPMTERDSAFSVDDSGKPSDVCECVGHPLIIDDEPWIPQSLAAEIMQSVADGECDPQQAADFLAGDYVRSHSVWFHFTLAPRYFSAVDEIREEHVAQSWRGGGRKVTSSDADENPAGRHHGLTPDNWQHPLGKLPGSVWEIATQPLIVPAELGIDHFAAFPMEWPRRIIKGWSPEGICVECGFLLGSTYDSGLLGVRKDLRAKQAQGPSQAVLRQDLRQPTHCEEPCEHEVPQTDDAWLCGGLEAGSPDGAEERLHDGAPPSDGRAPRPHVGPERSRAPQERDQDGQSLGAPRASGEGRARRLAEAGTQAVRVPSLQRHDPDVRDALSCPNCGCGSFRPAVIADPFGGTGTTALVAHALGRHGISVDLSGDYCRLARWRTTDPGEIARAKKQPKPKPVIVHEGQEVLFT